LAFVAIPNCVRVDAVAYDSNSLRPVVNTFGVKFSGPATATMVQDTAQAIMDNWCNHPGSWPATITWQYTLATALDTATAPQREVVQTVAGTAGNGYPNMAGVVDLFTAIRGRSYRGRIFAPIAQNSTTVPDGRVAAGWATGMATIAGDVITGLAAMATPGSLAVLSRHLAQGNVVNEVIIREVLGFIRRRLDG
jgi:hypothetical protein